MRKTDGEPAGLNLAVAGISPRAESRGCRETGGGGDGLGRASVGGKSKIQIRPLGLLIPSNEALLTLKRSPGTSVVGLLEKARGAAQAGISTPLGAGAERHPPLFLIPQEGKIGRLGTQARVLVVSLRGRWESFPVRSRAKRRWVMTPPLQSRRPRGVQKAGLSSLHPFGAVWPAHAVAPVL